ncbi:unnamed protein product [Zymoseptoria tritici ST99CH_1A5]|uniref:Uncharacterized protein n=1 Tax=Zymoseptoria tritici ST99CH_1A5 TaxID=1276529 RepID=A0A1Y6LC08_ZYMTR|nr:unnamed protein product [Zymoseptoria tritici ST99CH_1A5]
MIAKVDYFGHDEFGLISDGKGTHHTIQSCPSIIEQLPRSTRQFFKKLFVTFCLLSCSDFTTTTTTAFDFPTLSKNDQAISNSKHTLQQTTTMSAPNQGRQSPEPERQSDSQTGTQASQPNDQNAGPGGAKPAEQSKETLEKLGSNPGGPLDEEAKKKTAK